jgi:diaminopimelate epimerase
MPIPFTKYSGCGNDFILIDNRQFCLSLKKKVIQRLCHRQFGVGADGLIFLEQSHLPNTKYCMKIFNSDGSEAEMCGNGLRCLAQYIRSFESKADTFFIQTMYQCLKVSFTQNLVNASMPPPSIITNKKIVVEKQEILLYCLDTGVPHAIHIVDDLEKDLLFKIAPSIRFHSEFGTQGINVNFVKTIFDQALAIRTYERGVEKETLACGTGATASAIVAAAIFDIPSPITVYTKSDEVLTVSFQKNGSCFSDLMMSGPATKIFEGILDENFFGFRLKSSIPIE